MYERPLYVCLLSAVWCRALSLDGIGTLYKGKGAKAERAALYWHSKVREQSASSRVHPVFCVLYCSGYVVGCDVLRGQTGTVFRLQWTLVDSRSLAIAVRCHASG